MTTPEKVALTEMAPGNAALMILLRMDRIRRSPYADDVRRLLEVFYDFKTLLWSSAVDPVRDFDALLIATPNPYRVTQSFLAARHHLPLPRMRRLLEESVAFNTGARVRWRRTEAGLRGSIPSPPLLPSDRRVLILRPRLTLLTRPADEDLLTRREATDSETEPNAGEKAEPTLLERLQAMDDEGPVGGRLGHLGRRGPLPGMLLQAINLPRLVRLPPDVPPPFNVQVLVPPTAPARARGMLSFVDAAVARRFLAAVRPRLDQARHSIALRLLGVGALLDALKLKQQGDRVLVEARLTRDQVKGVLEMMRNAIPQVYVPGMPPRIRDAAPAVSPTSADAGPDEAPDAAF